MARMSSGRHRAYWDYKTEEDTFSGSSVRDGDENETFLNVMKRMKVLQGYMNKRLQQLYDEKGEDSDDQDIERLRDWLDLSNNPTADADFGGVATIQEALSDLLEYMRENPIMMDDDEFEECNVEVKLDDRNEEMVHNGEQTVIKGEVKEDHDGKSPDMKATGIVEEVMVRNPLGPEVPKDQPPPGPRPSLLRENGVSPSPRGAGRGVRRMDREDQIPAGHRSEYLQPNGLQGFEEDYPPHQTPFGSFMPRERGGYMMLYDYGNYPHPGFVPEQMMGTFSHPGSSHHSGKGPHRNKKRWRPNQPYPTTDDHSATDDVQDGYAPSDVPMSESETTSAETENVESLPDPGAETSEIESLMSFSDAAKRCFAGTSRSLPDTSRKEKAKTTDTCHVPHRETPVKRFKTTDATPPISNDVAIDENAKNRLSLREKLEKGRFTIYQVGQKQMIEYHHEPQPERCRNLGRTPRKDRTRVTLSRPRTDEMTKKSTVRLRPVGHENSATSRKSLQKERSSSSTKISLPFSRLSSKRQRPSVIHTSSEDSDSEPSEDEAEIYQPQDEDVQTSRSRSVAKVPPTNRNRRSKSVPRRIAASPERLSPEPEPPVIESVEKRQRKEVLLLKYLAQLDYSEAEIIDVMHDPALYRKLSVMLQGHVPDLEDDVEDPPASVGESPQQTAQESAISPSGSQTLVVQRYRSRSFDSSTTSLPSSDEPPPSKKPRLISTGGKKKKIPLVFRPEPSITSGVMGDDSDDDAESLVSLTPSARQAAASGSGRITHSHYKPPDAFVIAKKDKVKVETDFQQEYDVKLEDVSMSDSITY